MSVWSFLMHNRAEVLQLTLEHLWMVGVSMLLALAAGLPLGIAVSRWRGLLERLSARPAAEGPGGDHAAFSTRCGMDSVYYRFGIQ